MCRSCYKWKKLYYLCILSALNQANCRPISNSNIERKWLKRLVESIVSQPTMTPLSSHVGREKWAAWSSFNPAVSMSLHDSRRNSAARPVWCESIHFLHTHDRYAPRNLICTPGSFSRGSRAELGIDFYFYFYFDYV